jgi:hypothetical protein
MLVYMLVISKEHILVFWFIHILFNSSIRFNVFLILNVLGNVMYSLMILVRKEAILYAGAFIRFITSLMVMGDL